MNSFGLLTPYLKRYKFPLLIGLFFLLGVDGFQIIIPWLIRHAIDILMTDTPDRRRIAWIGAYILGCAVGIGVTRFLWRYLIIGISRKIETDIRNRFYRHLQKLSCRYFDQTSVGDLMALATNDIEAVRMMCGMALVAFTDSAFLSLASLVMMLSINLELTLFVLIPLPVLTLTIVRLGPKMHNRFREVQAGFSAMTQKAQETFSGIKVIKSFVQESAESANFKNLNQSYIDQNMKLVKLWGIIHPTIWGIAGVCSVIILLLGGGRVMDGRMTMGDFVAFNSYLGILVWPMIAIGWVVNLYQRGKASLSRLNDIFSVSPEITSQPGAIQKKMHGHIEIRNLTFGYSSGNEVLKNINLIVRPGEWLAIMGPTGSSKSTLVHLIPRYYEPPSGTIFIDGIDVRAWDLESLTSQIAIVPQQSFLFSDSILNNIRFGLDIQSSRLEEYAAMSQLQKDVTSLPDGYETIVGEKGVTLSGGQKQRVAIARALAAESPVLIFDDALSAVDAETEDQIIHQMQLHYRHKTVLIVSHRVAFASKADRILFLVDGTIAEEGTHEQLIAKKGRYFQVYENQRLIDEMDQKAVPMDINSVRTDN